jgi:hypothetical protein
MNENKYNKIVKASAWYDLIITAPFAFPILAQLSIENFIQLHEVLNFPGTVPVFDQYISFSLI